MDVDQFNTLRVAASSDNPSGAWAGAPALAASTVDMTNTSGFPVVVYVSSGTVTVVKVDGVTTGLTSGAFRLRPGGVINLPHSVDPTLHWVYDA